MEVPKENDLLAPWSAEVINGFRDHHEDWGVPLSVGDLAEAARVEFVNLDAQFRTLAAELSMILIPAGQEADLAVEKLIRASNKVIGLKSGERFNDIWAEAGHLNESTRIPDRAEDRLILAGKLVTFYTKRPDWENPGFGLSVAGLTAAVKAAAAANKEIKAKELTKSKLLRSCNASARRLRIRLRALITEVKQVLPPDDPRWKSMGLNTPASHRASKATRDLKSQTRAQMRLERTAVNTRKRAEHLKASAEKTRFRSELAQASADKLKDEARQQASKAEAMFRKADQLDQKVKEGAAALSPQSLPAPRATTTATGNGDASAPPEASSDTVSLSS